MRRMCLAPVIALLFVLALPRAAADGTAEHDDVRARVARGELVPLSRLTADALERHPGKVIEVEVEGTHDAPVYEIEILRADGTIVELEYDARDGRLLEVEIEDEVDVDGTAESG